MEEKKYYIQTLKSGFSFRMRYIPGGVFAMGSENTKDALWRENPVHKVALHGYYIGEYPVTQALWNAIRGKERNPSYGKGDQRPVEQVSWFDIVGNKETTGFLEDLNKQTADSRPKELHYRLPTEAEWEYAARAGENWQYAGSENLREVGWYGQNSQKETKEVGKKQPNGFQLYDMSGNVWEWCSDWVSESYYQECFETEIVENPKGPENGRFRIVRGGSWSDDPRHCRVTYRGGDDPTARDNDLGFRLVLGG